MWVATHFHVQCWSLFLYVLISQQVLDSPEPLRNLSELIAAQMEYHKKAYEILSELAPVINGIQVEHEVGCVTNPWKLSPKTLTIFILDIGQLPQEP